MKVQIVTPAPRGSRLGNRVTALRWAAHLRALGHRVRVRQALDDEECDLVVALHAERSADAVQVSKHRTPERPVVLILTGTDVYGEGGSETLRSLKLADRIVALQEDAREALPPSERARASVIHQSASPPARREADPSFFDALVVAHLREVKDPLLTARAARAAPRDSRLRVRLVGRLLDAQLGAAARAEEASLPRFHWLGERSYGETQALIAGADVLVVSSIAEGGPAVVSEALAAGTPLLSTPLPLVRELLGEDYPGLFPVGDASSLSSLLGRCERDPSFLEDLQQRARAAAPAVLPETERRAIFRLLAGLPGTRAGG